MRLIPGSQPKDLWISGLTAATSLPAAHHPPFSPNPDAWDNLLCSEVFQLVSLGHVASWYNLRRSVMVLPKSRDGIP